MKLAVGKIKADLIQNTFIPTILIDNENVKCRLWYRLIDFGVVQTLNNFSPRSLLNLTALPVKQQQKGWWGRGWGVEYSEAANWILLSGFSLIKKEHAYSRCLLSWNAFRGFRTNWGKSSPLMNACLYKCRPPAEMRAILHHVRSMCFLMVT